MVFKCFMEKIQDSGVWALLDHDQEVFLSNLGKWGRNNQIREVKVGVIQTETWKEFIQERVNICKIKLCLTFCVLFRKSCQIDEAKHAKRMHL